MNYIKEFNANPGNIKLERDETQQISYLPFLVTKWQKSQNKTTVYLTHEYKKPMSNIHFYSYKMLRL